MSLFLGFDCGTQSLKAVLVDASAGAIVATVRVDYSRELPEYGCAGGFLENADPLVRHADPRLWLAALDLVLAKMRDGGPPMSEISGLGGAAQQHGTVYLNDRFPKILRTLETTGNLAAALAPAFSRATSPIWMDASTAEECREFEAHAGGRVAARTGSPATERFSGPQIRKFAKTEPDAYAATRRIHLVSSFLCSVLAAEDAPVDGGDGSGMNLLDIGECRWDADLVGFAAPGLRDRLPQVVGTPEISGKLSPYFEKYGLRAGIPVVTWTGDNPASLVGSGAMRPGTAVVSLGTSDTFFAATTVSRADSGGTGHLFGNPAGGRMALVCFRNGSPARERVCREAGVDLAFFDRTASELSEGGIGEKFAAPWFEPETTPKVATPGLRANFDFTAADAATRIRAVVATRALSMRAHSLAFGDFPVIRVTGGASRSAGIAATLADVFGATVESVAIPDSAALGAAMIAAHVAGGFSYERLAAALSPATGVVRCRPSAHAAYAASLEKFRAWESASAR